MTNDLVTVGSQASLAPSTIFKTSLERAVSLLDTDREVTPLTQLVPIDECRQVVMEIDTDSARVGPDRATDFTRRLLACYPNLKPHDVKGYTLALTAIFAAYPETICKRICDPVKGLPGRLTYLPNAGDLNGALDAEMKRRTLIRANAIWHLREHERRHGEAKERAETEARRGTAEYRAKVVKEALKINQMSAA